MRPERVIRYRVPKLLSWQRDFVDWNPPAGTSFATSAVLSAAFGTGKTFTAAARASRIIMEHGGPGRAVICAAPTSKTLDSTMPSALERFLPPSFIRARAKPHGTTEWILQNGTKVHFWSMRGYIDSVDNVIALWADEVHDPLFLDQHRWDRFIGRTRGEAHYRELIASGIAIRDDRMHERFDHPKDSRFNVILPGLKDSWAGQRDPSFIERSVSNKPKELRDTLINGGWTPAPDKAFPHLVLDVKAEDSNVWHDDVVEWMTGERPVFLSLDNGEQFGALVCAPIKVSTTDEGETDGLLAIQSWAFDRYAADDVVAEILETTDYKIQRVFIDTDAPRDVRKLVKQQLPTVPIEDLKKGGREWRLETKLERFRWAICDGNGNRRFLLASRMLKEGKRGLAHLLRTAEVKPDGKLSKPNDEHVRDCAVYAVCCSLRPKKKKPNYAEQ